MHSHPLSPVGLFALLALTGCNLLAPAVPCHVDANCAPRERCRAGACVARAPIDGGGVERDAGVGDAGLDDAGLPPVECQPQVVVTAGAAPVPAGQPLKLTLDHAALTARGFAADGSDLHVVYGDGGDGTPLPRALDPRSSWNREATELWFPLAGALEAGASTGAYFLRSRAEEAPDNDESRVFPAADFFEREDSDVVEAPWSAPYGGVGVRAGGLEVIDVTDGNNRPFVDLAIPAQSGRFELVLGFHFVRTGTEGTYRVHFTLGDAAAMIEPLDVMEHFARDGAAVSLVWAGAGEGLPAEETLAADVVGGYTPLEPPVTGSRHLVVRTDLAADRYDVIVDDEVIGATLPFVAASDVVSRFRLTLWQVSANGIGVRRLEYVYVVPLLADEPTVEVVFPPACQ